MTSIISARSVARAFPRKLGDNLEPHEDIENHYFGTIAPIDEILVKNLMCGLTTITKSNFPYGWLTY